jgi:hypothetical protein
MARYEQKYESVLPKQSCEVTRLVKPCDMNLQMKTPKKDDANTIAVLPDAYNWLTQVSHKYKMTTSSQADEADSIRLVQ